MADLSLTDVLIVGAGPVGLTLANVLARYGIPFRIIDRIPTYQVEVRAKGLTPRTEEIFEDLGILDQIHERGQRNLPMRFYNHEQVISEVDPASDPANHPTPDVPYRGVFWIGQNNTEAVLRELLVSQGGLVELDCLLIDVVQHADHIVANVVHGGKHETIQARYLVGCDGGHSTVRHLGDFSFLGETLESEHYINGGLNISGLDPSYLHNWPVAGKGMGVVLTPMCYDGTWVFQATISPDEHDISLETFQRIFAESASLPDVRLHELYWSSIWRPNIRMVDQYRHGRLFLAGDAAHVHSAAGGQGMNTGIGDAYNLGWKIAMVRLGAPEALLDTYQAERLPVARAVLASTTARHQAFLHAEGSGAQAFVKFTTGNDPIADTTQLSITYRGSPLACDLDETTGIRAGDRAPDAPCVRTGSGEKVRLFELFRGPHFTLLTFGDRPALQLPDAFNEHLHAYTIIHPDNETVASDHVLVDLDGYAHRFYGVSGDALILVRPDGYVGLTGGKIGQEPLIDYLRNVVG
jgi:2-polyprenyl-6-methoxyphenol hydroxylase-like FAD-dependent oxidoreductase